MSDKKTAAATDEVAALKKELEDSKAEIEALKVVNSTAVEEKQEPVVKKLSDKEREFAVGKKKYRFIDVPAIWASGKKISIEDAVKDEKLQASLASAKSRYIQKV
jgi:hypothetical protein